tara:strand:- start:1134 stop:1355 length:222 start_codon:yes stop_codon:yes gene_type:complete
MINFYNVDAKVWKSFKTDKAKAMYNKIMDDILMDQYSISPIEKAIHHNDWWVICHKIAAIAALATNKIIKDNE